MMGGTYQASPIKRRRASHEEMETRAQFLIDYADRHGPVTVRQLFYAATVAGIPGVDKTEAGYAKVQVQVLDLRRAGRLAYANISDATRYMRKPSAVTVTICSTPCHSRSSRVPVMGRSRSARMPRFFLSPPSSSSPSRSRRRIVSGFSPP